MNLTPTQLRVVRELAETGYTNAEIAERLGISVGTVKSHLREASIRLDIRTRAGLVGWYYRRAM